MGTDQLLALKRERDVKIYGERETGFLGALRSLEMTGEKARELFGISELLRRTYKARYCLAVRAYRRGLFQLSRRLCASAYWAEYAADLAAMYWAGERLPNEQGARI